MGLTCLSLRGGKEAALQQWLWPSCPETNEKGYITAFAFQMGKEHRQNISHSKIFLALLHYILALCLMTVMILFKINHYPLGLKIFPGSLYGIPLPPCFNFTGFSLYSHALFTSHLKLWFNWRLVWIWIEQKEGKCLLDNCALQQIILTSCSLRVCRRHVRDQFVQCLVLWRSFPSHAKW